jgi:hypothetical protein
MPTSQEIAERSAAIARETAEALKAFPREIALIMYMGQIIEGEVSVAIPEDTPLHKTNSQEAGRQVNKLLDEARLKWEYATEAQKKQAMEMAQIIQEGNERIRQLYN